MAAINERAVSLLRLVQVSWSERKRRWKLLTGMQETVHNLWCSKLSSKHNILAKEGRWTWVD